MPVDSVEVENVAVVTPAVVDTAPVPNVVVPFLKVTVPVGLAAAVLPGLFTVMVAVNVTGWPGVDGFADELTLVLVLAWFTV